MNLLHRIFLLALGLSLSIGLMAQNQADRKAARTAIQSYAQEHVIPVMSIQRAKLDAFLTADEQAQLETLRSEMKALRDQHRAQRKEFRHAKGERPEPTAAQKTAFREMRESMKTHREAAFALMEAHEGEILDLLREILPERQQWRKDIRAIMEEHRPEKGVAGSDQMEGDHPGRHHEGRRKGMRGGHRGMHGMMHGGHTFSSPIAFLLWDGQTPDFDAEAADLQLNIFPNPAQNSSNIRYEVKTAGMVTIKLLDLQGNVIRTLTSESKRPGTYEEHVLHEDLKPGVYLYQLETADGIETGKLKISTD